jgi:predicted nuclease of predicted toxin-antitoxin system
MRFLLDACVDIRVGEWLRRHGHDAVHLRDQGLQRLSDSEIFRKAAAEGRCVVTFDLDFGEIAALTGRTRGSVILLRLADPGFLHVVDRLSVVLAESAVAVESGAVITVEEARYRIRYLPIGRDTSEE